VASRPFTGHLACLPTQPHNLPSDSGLHNAPSQQFGDLTVTVCSSPVQIEDDVALIAAAKMLQADEEGADDDMDMFPDDADLAEILQCGGGVRDLDPEVESHLPGQPDYDRETEALTLWACAYVTAMEACDWISNAAPAFRQTTLSMLLYTRGGVTTTALVHWVWVHQGISTEPAAKWGNHHMPTYYPNSIVQRVLHQCNLADVGCCFDMSMAGTPYSDLLKNPSAVNNYLSGLDLAPMLVCFSARLRPQRCPKTCCPRLQRRRHVLGHLCGLTLGRKRANNGSKSCPEG
jgi:hypothetical protein